MSVSALAVSLLVAVASSAAAAAGPPPALQRVATWSMPEAAVATLVQGTSNGGPASFPGPSRTSALLTTFGFGSGDGVWAMRNLSGVALDPTAAAATSFVPIDRSIRWPNMARVAPSPLGAAGWGRGRSLVLAAGGFFPNPTKATGQVVLTDVSDVANAVSYTLSHPKTSWFYHNAVWVDVNGDGRLDVVAARAYFPTLPFQHSGGELVWLEQPPPGPPGAPLNASWPERVLISPHGPDVDFVLHDFDGDGTLEVLAGQYFAAKALTLFWCDAPWAGCSPDQVHSREVGGGIGPIFSVSLADLNGDGRLDVLTTTNEADGTGRPYAVTPPPGNGSARTGQWGVHPMGPPGYAPRNRLLPGQGGPGKATAFTIHPGGPGGAKPAVLLSGDDNGTLCVLTADSPTDPADWGYSVTRLYSSAKGTIGSPAVGDVDGDGWADVLLPSYAENLVELLTFKPPSPTRDAAA